MSIKNNIFFRVFIWFFDEFNHDEFDLKCPICKLNNPGTYTKCAHCDYEFTDMETLERTEIDRKRYYKYLTLGIIASIVFLAVFTYIYNKYYS